LEYYAQVDTEILAAPAIFYISSGAKAYVGIDEQMSNFTTNDYSVPVTYRIIAEDETTFRDYIVTITIADRMGGEGRPSLVLSYPSLKTYIYPLIIPIGQWVKIQVEVGNASDTDYPADGHVVGCVYRVVDNVRTQIPEATIPIDKFISKRIDGVTFYETFSRTFQISDYFMEGLNNIEVLLSDGGSDYAPLEFTVVRNFNSVKTLAFSQRLNVFEGERDYEANSYLKLNNDLYASWILDDPDKELGEDDLPIKRFYLQDVDSEVTIFDRNKDQNIDWQLEFHVNNPVMQVIFQSLVVEAGKLFGGEITIDLIEYKNSKYNVVQDPFEETEDTDINPWQPIWKNDKWYLSIQNAIDTNAIIQSQKIKGMWLRITLRGPSDDPIFVRSVMTKIANLFN
jgi:hypothetical protein